MRLFEATESVLSLDGNSENARLDLLQVGEFLHQLLHAVTVEHDGELGVFAISFANQDSAFAIFCVANALSLSSGRWLQPIRGCPSRASEMSRSCRCLGLPPKNRAMLSIDSGDLRMHLRSCSWDFAFPAIRGAS